MKAPLYILISLLCLWSSVLAQKNDVCLECHSDPSLTTQRLTGTVSLCVTADSLKGSPHENLSCIECHASLKGTEDFPHGPVRAVNCGTCHDDQLKMYMQGFFKKLQDMGYGGIPACSDCHGRHNMAKHADTRRVCGLCHQNELKMLEASVHGQKGDKDGRPLSCTSCHEPHFKTRRETMTATEWEMTLVKGCIRCHKKESADYLDSKHYQTVAAGDSIAPTCIRCHGDHNILSPTNPAAPTSVEHLDNLCSTCHKGYAETLHKKEGANPRLMTCVACHTGHKTQMMHTAGGGVVREQLPQVCNQCHADERHARETLAHGKIMSISEGGVEANCTECHVYHWRKDGGTREASLRQQCQNCHVKENQEYQRSMHGIARAKGHDEAPTCVTCHGEKDIKKVAESMRPQFVIDLCSKCHANRDIALKFQLNPDVVKSYKKTYHGQVYSLGYQGAEFATCVNCHGNHDIRDPKDPASLVSRQNIVATCARCHKDANENFVAFLSHYDPHGSAEGATAPTRNVSFAERAMNGLLLGVFAFFGLHTILWFIREVIERKKNPRIKVATLQKHWVQRFTPWQRFLHILMVSSFLLLAMTGLPLKFSNSTIAYWIASHLANLRVAAIAHRVGACMTFAYFALHIGSLLYYKFVKREKGLFWGPNSLVPNLQDAKDLRDQFKYFFGFGNRPRFGRWTYWEKFDYMAVFWGVAVIGMSGLVLWFPEYFTKILPGWTINLAHIVHSEEALLAVGFIFTVHFFNSHLRPGKFPFDDVIFTGRESIEEMSFERPRELAILESTGAVEHHIVPPMKTWHRTLLVIFGWSAFTICVVLLSFIVISMLFSR